MSAPSGDQHDPSRPAAAADPSDPAAFGLGPIGQILVPVADVERATAFYRDVLGMRLLFAYPGFGAFFDAGGVRLFLGVPEAGQPAGPITIYYAVADIQAAAAALTVRGARISDQPHVVHRTDAYELWMAGTVDPDGNPVLLMCERPLA
jgi:methylmalonyl-CoA/ethylmalonyl-CoA epimerase